jgi:hypothetical protein
MTDKRIIVTLGGVYAIPEGQEGTPIKEAYPAIKLPRMLQGAKIYEPPHGPVIARPETQENRADKGPDKPIVFPPRAEGIRTRDNAFYARLAKAYEKVGITAQPMRYFGGWKGDIEKPEIAAEEVRVLLMRHFPDGPGMAAVAQKAATRYNAALDKSLEKGSERKPKMTVLARRWGMFCHDLGNAEREHYDAGYRPAMVDPNAIDFSQIQLTGRDRKAAVKDHGVRRERDGDLER